MNATTISADLNTAIAALQLVQQIEAAGVEVVSQLKTALTSKNAAADTAILDQIIANAAAGKAQSQADLAVDSAASGSTQ